MNMREEVVVNRTTEAVMIPSGEKVLVPEGARATITQSLGGSYTLITERGLMVRISGREVEAIGKPVDEIVELAPGEELAPLLLLGQFLAQDAGCDHGALGGMAHDDGEGVQVRPVHVVPAACRIHLAVGLKGEVLEQADQRLGCGVGRALERFVRHVLPPPLARLLP